ncbi:50S ribosomal protein L18 [Candidatus Saccharibacteria bacterium]|jgi:large subunit ribosomal protein L18|nr:50S ribosomal protein L18 [Candidatus Saccharibacteria bacterium]MBP7834475.1 50S ribosomal protein L18 [Candidatus Saccharibacteria bacterium]
MNRLIKKNQNLALRKNRVRSTVHGTAQRPRLTVSITNLHISAQIIDDEKSSTLASATTVGQKLTGSLSDKAVVIGSQIAKSAKKAKINKVVFDRNGRLYHGRIKALADAARAEGLEF